MEKHPEDMQRTSREHYEDVQRGILMDHLWIIHIPPQYTLPILCPGGTSLEKAGV